jgi:hypothetical protein
VSGESEPNVTHMTRASVGHPLPCDYILPLRWEDDSGLEEMTCYLRELSRHVRVIVVDGSPDALFARHRDAWDGMVRHLRPDAEPSFSNGKVTGVYTGMRHASADAVIIADDDVRYDPGALGATVELLRDADLVRPQNYFASLPWHARWDTARTLLNRCFGADYPGTVGVRRATFLAMGGYDGDTMFENLELIRTVRAWGGSEKRALGLYVRRLPPSADQFRSQRVRQAYDDLAQPARMVLFLAVLPVLGYALGRRRIAEIIAGAAATVGLAEVGRRRQGGTAVFPASATVFAPLWVLERGICGWAALAQRLTGGVRYRGGRIKVAAHSVRALRKRASRGHAGLASLAGLADLADLAGATEPAEAGGSPDQ